MRSILITGSEGNLGSALAKSLLEKDVKVFGIDKSADSKLNYKEYSLFAGDVLDDQFMINTSDYIESLGIELDGIVNCFYTPEALTPKVSGVVTDNLEKLNSSFRDYSSRDFIIELGGNVAGLHNVLRFFLPKELNRNCSIVNISSILGIRQPNPSHLKFSDRFRYKPPGYPVSKAAVIAYTEYCSNLFSGSGFRFNSLAPGFIDHGQNDEFMNLIEDRLNIKKYADLNEIIEPIEFLLSNKSIYMTGSTLIVDGGFSTT